MENRTGLKVNLGRLLGIVWTRMGIKRKMVKDEGWNMEHGG